jgi:GxxExxY protein
MKAVHVPTELEMLAKQTVHAAFDTAYPLDLIFGGKLLVALKAVEAIASVHPVQVLRHLGVLKLPLGLRSNFNVPLIKDGITRVLNLDFQIAPPVVPFSRKPAMSLPPS